MNNTQKTKTTYMIKMVEEHTEDELDSFRSRAVAIRTCIKHAQDEIASKDDDYKTALESEEIAQRMAWKILNHRVTRYKVIKIVEDATGECIECGLVFATEG